MGQELLGSIKIVYLRGKVASDQQNVYSFGLESRSLTNN